MIQRQISARSVPEAIQRPVVRGAFELRALSERASKTLFRMELLILSLAGLFFLGSAVAIALWWIDAGTLKARIDAASPDGLAISFPLARTQILQERLGVYGFGLCVAGLLALAFQRRLVAPLRRIARESAELYREWRAGLREWMGNERGHVLSLALIVIIAAVVRLAFIHQDMRYDEADAYLTFASRSLLFGLSEYPEPGNHVLNTLLTHISVRLFGDAPWALRLPTLITGILIVPAAYWGLRGWLGRWPALIAAGLTAGSSFLVHYSVNARGYGFVVLAFCVELALCHRLATRPNRGVAVLFGVVSALGFYAVPTMLFPFGACLMFLVVFALWQRSDGRSPSRVGDIVLAAAVTVALTLVFYGPVFIVSGPGAVTSNKYVSAMSWTQLFDLLGERLTLFAHEMTRTPGIAFLLAVGVLVWITQALKRGAPSVVLAAVFFAWCAVVVAALQAAPYGRVWTFAMPLLYGLGAAGLVAIVERIARNRTAALVVLSLGLTTWMSLDTLRTRSPSFSPSGERFESAQEVATFLKETLAPAEARILAVNPVRPSLWYYLQREGFPADVMSNDSGGHAFTHAVVDVPLEEFNEVLHDWNLPPLGEGRLRPVREFPGVIVYRIEPPLRY